MGGRIRGASGLSTEVQLGAGSTKLKATSDGTLQVLESDGSTKGTVETGDLGITGTATGISKAMVGLGNCDNTSDANKPVSTAAQTALDAKQASNEKGQADGYCPLDSTGKIASTYLNIEAMEYKGSYNAATNSPAIANGTGDKGDFYIVSHAGTQVGVDWLVGDSAIYSGSVWERVGRADLVSSVAGKTGVVTLDKSDVGLANVDNTTDANKPISTATQTALDLKAPLDDAALTGATTVEGIVSSGNVTATEYHTNGGHLKFKTSTSDAIFYLSGNEQFQIYRHSGGDTHFTSTGGTGGYGFHGVADFADGIKLAGTAVTATAAELNYVDGVTSAIQTQFNTINGTLLVNSGSISSLTSTVNNAKVRHVSITHIHASGSGVNFGTALASGAFVSRVVVKITEAFSSGCTLKIGSSADDDGFGTVDDSDLQSVGTQIIFHAPYNNEPLASSIQAQYKLSGNPSAGACTISIQQELI